MKKEEADIAEGKCSGLVNNKESAIIKADKKELLALAKSLAASMSADQIHEILSEYE